MARLQLSALITNIDGKVKGTIFQRNGSGLIMRNEGGKINRKSPKQLEIRAANILSQQYYQQLSPEQINAWIQYSKFANISTKKNKNLFLTGHQLFLANNMFRVIMSKTIVDMFPVIIQDPVFVAPPDIINIDEIRLTLTGLEIYLSASINPAVLFLSVYMTKPLKASQLSQYNKTYLIGMGDPSGNPAEIGTYYLGNFARLPLAGEWINVEVRVGYKNQNGISGTWGGRFEVQPIF